MTWGQRERFADRTDAGRRLAARVAGLGLTNPVVYGLPRGGVPVAAEVAAALGAPLDLIFVRKIGVPHAPEVAVGAVVDGPHPQTVINDEVKARARVTDAYLAEARDRELAEIERRRSRYRGDRPAIDPRGRAVVIVDDGLATGATMKAALLAMQRQGAASVCVAVPVAPTELVAEMERLADRVVCLIAPHLFHSVGGYYDDFHQLSDEETIGLLQRAWAAAAPPATALRREIRVPPHDLPGTLAVPDNARGLIVFAHGSGSTRLSPRNRAVADRLHAQGFATLLFDLLTPAEGGVRRNVFDIRLLADRIVEAIGYLTGQPDVADLPLGLFGASTGAGAALVAAAELGPRVRAVVSRGGRPDLAGPHLPDVEAASLLIVGGNDREVLELNRQALARLTGEKLLRIVPGAGHLFEEPGTLETVTELACAWFGTYLHAAGHIAPAPAPAPTLPARPPAETLLAALQRTVRPLPDPDDPAFAEAFDRYGAARVVLLGESSHGTSEFYRARAAITRRLVERHGFRIVALEADWPDAAAIDRHIAGGPGRARPARFPTWMWRNQEFQDFVTGLRRHNTGLSPDMRVRLYGLDLYSMNASIAAVLDYLDRVDPGAAAEARMLYGCLDRWSKEPAAYGRAAVSQGFALCEQAVTRALVDMLRNEMDYTARDGDAFFDAVQNARLIADAEKYYRVMYYGANESWNLRDRHMFDTLRRILDRAGPSGKAVIWAHNSHIGDARFTDMGGGRGELNIGQLCREAFGTDAALIGFGTHTGTVAAASDWDGPVEIKTVRPALPGSYEALCHQIGTPRFLLPLGADLAAPIREPLSVPRLERYIGVIYRPETERWSHYSHSTLPDQYDAFVWFDRTRAVAPLPAAVAAPEDDTWPFGL